MKEQSIERTWTKGKKIKAGRTISVIDDDNSIRHAKKVLKAMAKRTDVVITLSDKSKHFNEELRYALRSIETNMVDLGQVWLIGNKPEWVTGVKNIVVEDNLKPKDCNIINKILTTCRTKELSERFVFWSDDQLLKEPTPWERLPVSSLRTFKEEDKWYENCKGGWRKQLRDTLLRFGEGAHYYEPHTPMPMEKSVFIDMCEKYEWKNRKSIISTLYYNHSERKPLDDKASHIYGPTGDVETLNEKVKPFITIGYSDKHAGDVLKWAEKYFPKQSKYELDTPKGVLGNAIETALKHTGPEWNVLKVKANAFKREFEGRYTTLGCNDRKRVNKEFLIPMQALNHGVVKKKAPCKTCGGKKAGQIDTRDCIACTEKHIEKAQVLIDEWYLNNEYIAELSSARGNLGCAEDHIVRIDKSLACAIRDSRLIISRGGTYDVGRVYKLLRDVLNELGRR